MVESVGEFLSHKEAEKDVEKGDNKGRGCVNRRFRRDKKRVYSDKVVERRRGRSNRRKGARAALV